MRCNFSAAIIVAVLTIFVFITSSCQQKAEQKDLMVLAAASLSRAFDEIKADFEAGHKDVKITISYGPSGGLAKQIEKGARVDVYASAGQPEMDRLEASGSIDPGSRIDFATNQLCLVMRPGLVLDDWDDLISEGIEHIGIGGPVSPAGHYARSLLENRGLLDKLSDKLIPGNDVRQVMDYLLRGEVDAAIVYRTDAAIFADKGQVIISPAKATAADHSPIRYPIAIIKSGSYPQVAKEFISFITGTEGQAILSRNGFSNVDF